MKAFRGEEKEGAEAVAEAKESEKVEEGTERDLRESTERCSDANSLICSPTCRTV